MSRHLICLLLSAAAVFAQGPEFEVASIRPSPQLTPELVTSGKMRLGMKVEAGRVDIGYFSLRDLIQTAYEVKAFQISGPDWLTAQRFDIAAKLPEGATKEQVPAMLRALLEERFKLKTHRESRDQNVYALEIAKGGIKMKEAAPAPPDPANDDKSGTVIGPGGQRINVTRSAGGTTISGGPNGMSRMTMSQGGTMHMELERVSMSQLAAMLTPMLDRPVVDRTGLNGSFEVALELSMQDLMQAARSMGPVPALAGGGAPGALAASDPSGGTIFASVQQLGLRLEKQKAPVEIVVVDSAEKDPTEN